jgi:hypothetical protein
VAARALSTQGAVARTAPRAASTRIRCCSKMRDQEPEAGHVLAGHREQPARPHLGRHDGALDEALPPRRRGRRAARTPNPEAGTRRLRRRRSRGRRLRRPLHRRRSRADSQRRRHAAAVALTDALHAGYPTPRRRRRPHRRLRRSPRRRPRRARAARFRSSRSGSRRC